MKNSTLFSTYILSKNSHLLILAVILTLGFAARIMSIWFGYPLITHPDEPTLVGLAEIMLRDLNPNPQFFNYPSLVIYLQSLVMAFVAAVNYVFGIAPTEIPRVDFFIAGRAFAASMSTLSLIVIYATGKKLFNAEVGLLAAAIVAVSPIHVENSALVTTDIWVAVFSTLILFYCAKIYEQPTTKNYILAGLFLGLAASSKYTAVVFCVGIICAHMISQQKIYGLAGIRKLGVAGFSSALAFFSTTPFALFDSRTFLSHLKFERVHYRTGHLGAESESNTSYELYASTLLSQDGLGLAGLTLALLSIALLARKEFRPLVFVLALPIVLFIFVGNYKVFFSRNIVGAIPGLSLAAALVIYVLVHKLVYPLKNRWLVAFSYIGMLAIVCGPLVERTIQQVAKKRLPDTRWISLQWVNENIKEGSVVAIEGYAPPLDPKKYQVVQLGIAGLARKQDKLNSSVEFLILSSGSYGRFFEEDGKPKQMYANQANAYQSYFQLNSLVKQFNNTDGASTGPEIKIFKHTSTQ